MSISLSPTARELVRSTFFGKDFDSFRQEIIDALNSIFGSDIASNIVTSEQGVMLIEMNAYALSTLSWYGDRQADDTTLSFVRLRFAAVTIARQLGYKASSSIPALVDVRVQLITAPPVQLTIDAGTHASGPDGLVFETLSDLVFDPGQVGSGLPTGMTINSVVIDPALTNVVYVASSSGLLKTASSGTTWFSSNSGLTNTNLTSMVVNPVTTTTLYVGTSSSGIFKSIDSGVSWTAANSGLSNLKITALAIDPVTPSTVYAGTNAGGMYKSINGGSSWSQINGGVVDFTIQTIAVNPATPTILYTGAYSGGIYKSINGGLTWNSANAGLAHTNVADIKIDPITPTTLYAATIGGGIYKSTTSGTLWTPFNNGFTSISPSEIAIDPVTTTTVYVATTEAGVFKTTNGGADWASAVSGLTNTTDSAIAIDPTTTTVLYLGTIGGGVFGSTNGAVTWSSLNTGIDDPLKIVQMRQGQTLQSSFRSTGEPFQIFELPVPTNFSIAQDSPTVTVGGILWPEVNLITYDQTDQVEIEYGLSPPRVIFGDGIAGNIPQKDAEVSVSYFVTSGTSGSIASDTIAAFTDPVIAGTTPIGTSISNSSPSTPGSDPETIDSIKVNAPLVFQAAGRSVTSSDLDGWINSFVDPVYGAVSKGKATSPRSAIEDAEAQSIISTLEAFGVPDATVTRLSNYVESILSSNCSANVANAQILASDSIGRYVPAPSGLAVNLATFLNTIAESTVEAIVTDGSINLLSVDVSIEISITRTITNEALKTAIRDNVRNAVQTLLIGRDFGESLRIGDLYQTVEAVEGVEYSHNTITVRNNINEDISSSRLNQFGDLAIAEYEVISMGVTPQVQIV